MTYKERNAKAITNLHPVVAKMAQKLLDECERRKEDILITDTTRTIAEQNALYARGRSKSGKIVTYARGGESLHQYGCALDIVPINKKGQENYDDWESYIRIASIAKEIGFQWGGDWPPIFRDMPHLEYTQGFPIADFKTGKAQNSLVMPPGSLFESYEGKSIPEQIKLLIRAIPRAPKELVKSLQKRLDRLLGV